MPTPTPPPRATAFVAIQRGLSLALLRAPAALLRAIAGPPKSSPEGYPLDLQVQAVLRIEEHAGFADWQKRGVEGGRRRFEMSSQILSARPAGSVSVRDSAVAVDGGSITVRVYTPDANGGPLPALVYYHGGGFVLGSVDSHDGECRALAIDARVIVVSVDYRRAPEHRFPTAVLDGLAAFRWVVENASSLGVDPARIGIGGDSAGGNIAAFVARGSRGAKVTPAFQILIYPAVDFTASQPSRKLLAEGYMLSQASIDWFETNYLRTDADRLDHRASPLLASDHEGLAPALILTAGFDPLRDEGHAYAEALRAASVAVQYRCYEGLIHGFFSMSAGIGEAKRAFDDTVRWLRDATSRPSSRSTPKECNGTASAGPGGSRA